MNWATERPEKALQDCTIRIEVSNDIRGSGFFVAPGRVLTCAHIMRDVNQKEISAFWKAGNCKLILELERSPKETAVDVALLRLLHPSLEHLQHSYVQVSTAPPDLGDKLLLFGYPHDYPDGDSVTFTYEGEGFKGNQSYYKLKDGLVKEGCSGSPLLHLRSGTVCGMIALSRDVHRPIGGRAISTTTILNALPKLAAAILPSRHPGQGNHPFIYGASVAPEKFYGRQRERSEIRNRIGTYSPQSINVVGFRRSGKSSLLRLVQECPGPFFGPAQQPLIVKLDLQNRCYHTPKGLQEGLRLGIRRQIGQEPWQRGKSEDPFVELEGLQNLKEQGWRLIVQLDEFEQIGERLEVFQGWGEDWRAKAGEELLTLMVTSKRPIYEIYHSLGLTSPFDNIFSVTVLGALKREAWQQLVQSGLPDVSRAELEAIGALTGGMPYYVQLAAALLWQQGNISGMREQFSFQVRGAWKHLWEGFSEQEQRAVKATIKGQMLEAMAKRTVEDLQRYGLMNSDGTLFSDLFGLWLQGEK